MPSIKPPLIKSSVRQKLTFINLRDKYLARNVKLKNQMKLAIIVPVINKYFASAT